jgi:hypothetical protein
MKRCNFKILAGIIATIFLAIASNNVMSLITSVQEVRFFSWLQQIEKASWYNDHDYFQKLNATIIIINTQHYNYKCTFMANNQSDNSPLINETKILHPPLLVRFLRLIHQSGILKEHLNLTNLWSFIKDSNNDNTKYNGVKILSDHNRNLQTLFASHKNASYLNKTSLQLLIFLADKYCHYKN